MPCVRYIPLLLLALCLTGCSGGRNVAPDIVAQSGANSEDIWYSDGGARWAWTAVPRPRQLYTGLTGVRDPALYQYTQQPPQRAGGGKKSVNKVKTSSAPSRPPDCPPCPPADAAKSTPPVADAGSSQPAPQTPPAVSP